MGEISVLFCPPGKKPGLIKVNNEIRALEELLKGALEVKVIEEDGLCLLFNAFGDGLGLELNRVVQGDPIFGPCLFCRREADHFVSLQDEELRELENLLS